VAGGLATECAPLCRSPIHVIDVSYLANRGEAVFVNPSNLAGRHLYQGVTCFMFVNVACCPALRATWPPLPGLSSIL